MIEEFHSQLMQSLLIYLTFMMKNRIILMWRGTSPYVTDSDQQANWISRTTVLPIRLLESDSRACCFGR